MKNTTRLWQIVAMILTSAIIAFLLLPSTCESEVTPTEVTMSSDTVFLKGKTIVRHDTIWMQEQFIGGKEDFTTNPTLSTPVIGRDAFHKSLYAYDFDIPSVDTTFTLSGQIFLRNNTVEAINVTAHGKLTDTIYVKEPDTIVITNDIVKTESKVKL